MVNENYRILINQDLGHSDDWNQAISRLDGYSIFHDPRFKEVYESQKGFEVSTLVIKASEDAILGYASISTFSELGGIYSLFTTRSIMFAPPLFTDEKVLPVMLDHIKNIVPLRSVYLKIKGTSKLMDLKPIFKTKGYSWIPHLNFLIDLKLGKDEVWNRISKTRRKQIKRAEKRGISVEIKSHVIFREHYQLLKETYENAGLPLYDISFFQKAIDVFSKSAQTLIIETRVQNKLAAFRLVLLSGKNMYDWYAGSSTEYHSFYPNDLAVWSTLEWGIDNGYEVFDFGGAGHPDKPYGVREFKRKFGGEEVNFGVFSRINAPVRNWMLEKFRSLRS